MITTSAPPTVTPGAIVTTVFSGRHSRDTCLYGCVTWMTCATPGSASIRDASTRPSLPTSPDRRPLRPGHWPRLVPHLLDRADDAVDLGARSPRGA